VLGLGSDIELGIGRPDLVAPHVPVLMVESKPVFGFELLDFLDRQQCFDRVHHLSPGWPNALVISRRSRVRGLDWMRQPTSSFT
jgi:hypothetical protein